MADATALDLRAAKSACSATSRIRTFLRRPFKHQRDRRGGEIGVQRYQPNTNILETTFQTPTGSFKIIDFAPRFLHYDRAFRPTQLIRIEIGRASCRER